MANFVEAHNLVKKAEGGYANDPRDKGGETYKGISRVYNPSWEGWKIIDDYKLKYGTIKTNATISDIPDRMVEEFYKKNYWNVIKGDEIKNQQLINMIYDLAVNPVKPGAKQIVIDSLKVVNKDASIDKYDVNKINATNSGKLFNEIGKRRKEGYEKIGGYALPSWLNRLKDLGYTGVEIAKRNIGTTIAIIFGIGILTTGIIYLIKQK